VIKLIKAVIKRTGSKAFEKEIEYSKEELILNLGEVYDKIPMDQRFIDRNIVVYANPNDYKTGLEPNIYVININNTPKCIRIIFGNCIFFKCVNDNYVSLDDKDINFIYDYCNEADMTEREKAMAGLYEYNPEEVASRINK
jgi:hypothetical protein